MLYKLSQSPLPCDSELVSVVDTSLPSSTCIDDERDTKRGAEVSGTFLEELFFAVWR
jgi:hypothetical protein